MIEMLIRVARSRTASTDATDAASGGGAVQRCWLLHCAIMRQRRRAANRIVHAGRIRRDAGAAAKIVGRQPCARTGRGQCRIGCMMRRYEQILARLRQRSIVGRVQWGRTVGIRIGGGGQWLEEASGQRTDRTDVRQLAAAGRVVAGS